MGRSKSAPDDRPSGLTHNPFAALRADGRPAPTPPAVSPTDGPSDAAPTGRVVVRREKKGRGGKTVTRVSGLDLDAAALAALARRMKRALGAGASVDGDDVLLQGALGERAAAWLRADLAREVILGN